MPRGTRRTSYVRDGRGRFASTPGGGAPKRPPAKKASRGTNRLTRDNSGRITSVGGNGATARGGRLRTGAGNLRARQTDRLKGAPQGVVSRGGKARAGGGAPKVPPRIANRSAADQAHRDKLAKQWKTVEKPARRAYASMRSARRGAAGLIPDYPRLTKARKIRGDARFVSGNIEDQVGRLMRSPSRGKNKLTPQQRGQIVADTLYSARSLKARAAMTAPRRSTRDVRAARPGGTIAKPRGMKPGALATKAARSRAASAGRKGAAAKKPVGWMQSPEARKDRVDPMSAANRKDYARRLRAVPKAAQRAIQVERSARKQKFLVAGNTAAQLTNLSEGRMQLIANVGKRKNKLTPGQIDAITRTMSESARRLKVGMAMGGRGRMKYNPKALQLAPSTAARKIRGARPSSTLAKPKGLKPGALAAKRQKPATPKRTAEEQARRDLIARGLKKLPKEKRARAIAMRREMEGRVTAPGQPKPRMTQKERWLNRANVYERAAQRNMERIAQIERKHAPYRGDIAFNTQPGRIPLREQMLREQERGFELRKKAQAQLQRARELRNLATTNKGDAERKRQTQRDAVTVEKGARISTLMYGPGRVVRVNKKTVSYYSEQTGSVINVDKSWVKAS